MDKDKAERDLRFGIGFIFELIFFIIYMLLPIVMKFCFDIDTGRYKVIFIALYIFAMFAMYAKNEFFAMRFLKKYFIDEHDYRKSVLYSGRGIMNIGSYNKHIDTILEKPKKYDIFLVRFYNGYEFKIFVDTILFIAGVIFICIFV